MTVISKVLFVSS